MELARRLYSRVAARDLRSHWAIRMLVAQLGIAVREARRDPEAANEICRKAPIKGRRLEVRIVRLVAGGRLVPGWADQVPRWANAAAYLAHPPNGDPPPVGLLAAIRYINKRGGVRHLSKPFRIAVANWQTTSFADNGFHGDSGFWRGGGFYDATGERNTVEWYAGRPVSHRHLETPKGE